MAKATCPTREIIHVPKRISTNKRTKNSPYEALRSYSHDLSPSSPVCEGTEGSPDQETPATAFPDMELQLFI
jgi:hypothetical protein